MPRVRPLLLAADPPLTALRSAPSTVDPSDPKYGSALFRRPEPAAWDTQVSPGRGEPRLPAVSVSRAQGHAFVIDNAMIWDQRPIALRPLRVDDDRYRPSPRPPRPDDAGWESDRSLTETLVGDDEPAKPAPQPRRAPASPDAVRGTRARRHARSEEAVCGRCGARTAGLRRCEACPARGDSGA